MIHLISAALAQDPVLVLPPPPPGLPPLVTWIIAASSTVVAGCFPFLLAFLRAKFNRDAMQDNADMIHRAAVNGAALGAKEGLSASDAQAIALAYIKSGLPAILAATPQATDEHLRNVITAVMPPLQSTAQPPVDAIPPLYRQS